MPTYRQAAVIFPLSGSAVDPDLRLVQGIAISIYI